MKYSIRLYCPLLGGPYSRLAVSEGLLSGASGGRGGGCADSALTGEGGIGKSNKSQTMLPLAPRKTSRQLSW
jgi:hypothetical protein